MWKVGLGTVASDPVKVQEMIEGLPIAQAVFVGHSHYDHMLDLAASLTQPGWSDVPVYGSKTTRNILFGLDQSLAEKNWQPVQKDGAWRTVAPGLAYQAVTAEHAPHLTCGPTGLLYFPGAVPEPLAHAPRKAAEFKVGETFAFVFRLSNEHIEPSSCRQRTFTVYFAGSATSAPRGFPDESVEAVDVAILCVPSWKNAMGYPGRFLERLKPRVVVLSHFDDMFQERGVIRKTVLTTAFDEFLVEVQRYTDYERFERIVAPDVGETVLIRKP
jgi:L-ascorbate metabolism protein UlaG (beta-lactamase superfamily)